ncbi:MAG: amidohydrolase family protein [Flavobacteriaceae bacterium]
MNPQIRKLLYGFWTIIIVAFIYSCKENQLTGDLIITNVSVVDIANNKTINSQSVAIKNGKITSVTAFSESDRLESQNIIDGSAKFLIPSLWDMHTHYTTSSKHRGFLNLFIANGVLSVRDLWGDLESRDSLAVSNMIAPKIYLSGAIIDGTFTLLQGSLQPKSAEEAIRLVDSLHNKGADFIKVYDDLSEEVYRSIAKRCNELELPFAGHVPMAISAENAADIGQKSMEHLNGIWKSSTTKEKEIDSLMISFKEYFMADNLPAALNTFFTINREYSSSYDRQQAVELAKVLSKNETFVTPTLITIDRHWSRKGGKYKNLEQNKYVPDDLLQQWDPELSFPEKMFPPEAWESGKELLNTSMKITKNLQDNGVNILAGTDCGVSYVIPGFSIHEELKLLVEAGLSNADALRTATINPVNYFELSNSHGGVMPEMTANLVLLNANPLEDISNTNKIFGVIRNGTYLDRDYLDKLLEEAVIEK